MAPRSVAEVRELLGAEAIGLTDAEVCELRDAAEAFAPCVVGAYRAIRRLSVNAGATPLVEGAPGSAPPARRRGVYRRRV